MHGGMMDGSITPATPPPKNTEPALRRGYDLTQRFCVQCHVAPKPLQHNAAQWPQVVARMQNYMRQQKRPSPDPDQQKLILNYLEAGQRNP